MDIAVVDYGMGNLRSVSKALEHVAPGAEVKVTARPDDLRLARRVVVPGQGAMPDCMRELRARGLSEAVIEATRTKPFLGICIGLQMLFERSEEGGVEGLAVLPGDVRRFPPGLEDGSGNRLKIPHMGWNEVVQEMPHPLWAGITDASRFYFVHSYFVAQAGEENATSGRCTYGLPFTAAVARDNIFAVQFHPEKSQAAGLQLLRNFVHWHP
jgi:imidazole glycerol-phosphate synthase subunit HisH